MSADRVPIFQMGEVLLVVLQVDIRDRLAVALQEDIARAVSEGNARGVLIDISALDVVDSFMCRMLASMATITSVLDAETVIVGMQPAVAITVVELGLSLRGVRTALTVERGLALLGRPVGSGARGAGGDGRAR